MFATTLSCISNIKCKCPKATNGKGSSIIRQRRRRVATANTKPGVIGTVIPPALKAPRRTVLKVRPRVQVRLPRNLARPSLKVKQPTNGVPLEYLREKLAELSTEMLNGTVQPTHILAVGGKAQSQQQQQSNGCTLFPVHDAVITSYCSRIPELPQGQTMVPLSLPSPSTFPILLQYLYIRRLDQFATSLVPNASSLPQQSLAQLLATASRINGVWKNMCALGVDDESLWNAISVSWEAVLRAIDLRRRSQRL